VRLLIVDDNSAIRSAMRSTLENYDNVQIIGEAGNGEEAIQQAAKLHPDLILMDVSMPVLDGLRAAKIIRKLYPMIRIVMFSMHKIGTFIEMAKELGASGFVAKEDDGPSLRDAIDAIRHNKVYFPA